ncbi:MAG: YfiR family protein [Pseudomonadales bacterium]|nr:YfiR family protein [Pseudomonadales bacterium]
MARVPSAPSLRPFLVAVVSLVLLIIAARTPAQEAAVRERMIRAAVIYKIVKFVTWPETAFADATSFVVCGYGSASAISALESMEKRAIQGRPARLKVLTELTSASTQGCQVLYLVDAPRLNVESLALILADRPTLIIGETPEFARHGGMVTLLQESNRVGLEINLRAARRAGLEISAPLLQLATVVN